MAGRSGYRSSPPAAATRRSSRSPGRWQTARDCADRDREGDMHIAFIGIGNMGRPMLANLLKKGFSATAYDIVPAALDSPVALGAVEAGSPAEAAGRERPRPHF